MPRFRTLKEIDCAGLDVRLHCFACNHTSTIDGIIWMRFEERAISTELSAVQAYFPCRRCKGRDALILPATAQRSRHTTNAQLIAAFFHGMRSQAKHRRR